MSRKRIKLILLIAGLAILAAGLTVFIIEILNFSSLESRGFKELMSDAILPFYVFALISVTALSVAALMHSKDVGKTRPVLSGLFKAFACFWIAGGALSIIALVFILIFLY